MSKNMRGLRVDMITLSNMIQTEREKMIHMWNARSMCMFETINPLPSRTYLRPSPTRIACAAAPARISRKASSMGVGAKFSPPAVMIRSFLRPVMLT